MTACYNGGTVTGTDRGGLAGYIGMPSVFTNCYWKAGAGPSDYYGSNPTPCTITWPYGSNPNGNGSFTGPALTPAPAPALHTEWGLGAGSGPGTYWKNYTGRVVSDTGYPQLWLEVGELQSPQTSWTFAHAVAVFRFLVLLPDV